MKKNLLTAILLLTFLNGCITEKKRQKICQTCPVKIEKEVHDSIIEKLKDTTIYITQQGPIQYLENPCKTLCDSLGNLKPIKIESKKNGIKSTIKSVGNTLAIECETDSLKAVINGLKETIRITKEKEIKEVPVCHLDHKTKFDGFTFWWFWITACAIAIKFVVNKIQSKI
jgi:ribosomal protein L12E/L44/L45/RPP1/RPP2